MLKQLLAQARTLRGRLMLWNAGAVALTGLLILLAVRAGVRYTLIADLDEVLREDLKEIELHFAGGQPYQWSGIMQELDRKAEGHDFHRWFVRFYDDRHEPVWSSRNTPDLPPPTAQQKEERTFTSHGYRLSYARLARPLPETTSVCVGCSQAYVARDMATIDRLVFGTGLIVLLVSPLVGHLLTNRTIQPLAQMIQTTDRLHPAEIAERLPIRGTGDELDSLASTINSLLDRISKYLEQKHDFLANAAHDLRTPLAAIRSSVEVALGAARSPDQYREILGLVVEQCTSLQMLVNQLLLLAESDANRLTTDREPVPLDQVVAGVVEMFAGVAEEQGVELRYGEFQRAAVAGNRQHQRQVVSNLLDNAIKFTASKQQAAEQSSPAKGCVTINLVNDPVAGVVRLSVRDNGIGIAEQDLPHVFDRFYRADRGRGRDDGAGGGSGLGLSICKAIIDAHGGEFHVESQSGRGSTFTVTLPAVTTIAPASPAARKRSSAT